MNKTIAVIKGGGIGPEIVTQALRVLDKVAEKYGHNFTYNEVLAGGIAIDTVGETLPQATLDACLASDSVLLGAVGGPNGTILKAQKDQKKHFSVFVVH